MKHRWRLTPYQHPVTPRTYQQAILDGVAASWRDGVQRSLVCSPTGSGKTLIFSWLARSILPQRTLILAHREELIDQAIAKLHSATGIVAEKEMAESCASLTAPVVVASVQSMIRRLDRWPHDHFGLVVADEAHHAISDSWQKVLNHFAPARVLGVTATPDRGDKRNLGQYFERVAAEVGLFDLVHAGYLSPITLKSVPLEIDLTRVRTTAGDYNDSDLGDALAPFLSRIAHVLRDECAFRRTLVFLPLIATSEKFAAECRAAGLRAEHVCGVDRERREKLSRFASGDTEVLCNAMLLTEGFDDPGIDCVVVLRPTKSRALYSQMVGRGTRIAPGKRNLLLLDFLWLHERHTLIRPAHLVAKSDTEAREMTELAQQQAAGGGQGELELEGLASDAQAKREERLREELKRKAKRKARVMDAREFALAMHSMDVAEYEPAMPWESGPVTPAQTATLAKFGIDGESVQCVGHASKLLDLVINRSRQGLCTPRQMRMLHRFRHPSPETCTFAQATAFLNQRLRRS